jgi:hypothetical protein
MSAVSIESDSILLSLSAGERLLALRRGDLRLPLSAVNGIDVEHDGLRAARGLRAPGVAVPGVVKIGTWRRRGSRTFVSVRRGVPAIHVSSSGAALDALLVSTPHADAVAGAIRHRAGLAGDDRSAEVAIAAGDVTLAGTLLLPAGVGPYPAALIVPGSGPLDRDSNHRRARIGVSRDLAQALAARGIASLRYDRRGVGASGGSFLAAGFNDNARDAAAALRMLRDQPDVDPARCFLVGHSEGALLATQIAGDGHHDHLAGVVLLAGAAKSGEETLAWQTQRIAPTLPAPVRALLRLLRIDLVRRQAKNVERLRTTTADVQRMGGRKVNARWHRELIAFDPKPALARIAAPVLAVTGGKDLQMDPDDLTVIGQTVAGPVDTELIADLTHVLRCDAGEPSLSRYRKLLRQPTDAALLERVGTWVADRARPAPGTTGR